MSNLTDLEPHLAIDKEAQGSGTNLLHWELGTVNSLCEVLLTKQKYYPSVILFPPSTEYYYY